MGTHEDFDYYRSHHNLFEGYSITIQYDAATASQTRFRGGLDNLRQLTADEANAGDSDEFGTISGRLIAGSIDAHHTTQYTWLTEIRLDYREPQAGTEPQFHLVQGTGNLRFLEFRNLSAGDAAFIRAVHSDTVVNVDGKFFTVLSFSEQQDGDLRLLGTFDDEPVLVDAQEYRLRFNQAESAANTAANLLVNTDNLDSLLEGVAGNAQAMFNADRQVHHWERFP